MVTDNFYKCKSDDEGPYFNTLNGSHCPSERVQIPTTALCHLAQHPPTLWVCFHKTAVLDGTWLSEKQHVLLLCKDPVSLMNEHPGVRIESDACTQAWARQDSLSSRAPQGKYNA